MPKSQVKSFTLLELIIVIVIIGILATLGYSQYSLQVESSRLAEAKTRIGTMRQLATDYYWKNGALDSIQNSDAGVTPGCGSASYYSYSVYLISSTRVQLYASRCTNGGKTPTASRGYIFGLDYIPSTGYSRWACWYTDDTSACFGYPQW